MFPLNNLARKGLSHPDEIANFDFPQHAVALQRFRKTEWLWGYGLFIVIVLEKKTYKQKLAG